MSAKAEIILQAARTVFLTHGFSAATTDMIQREAGVSMSTVYEHYASKEAMFVAAIEAECAAWSLTLASKPDALGSREALAELARAYLKKLWSPSGLALYRVVLGEASRFPELPSKLYLAGQRSISTMVTQRLSQAVQTREIDLGAIATSTAADLFVGLVRGEPHLRYLFHSNTVPSAAQIDEWVEVAVATFMRAYGAHPP